MKMEIPGYPCSIKPKAEPCEEELLPLPPPFEASDDWEVTPLSGDNPFFTTVMSKTHIQKQFQLTIPLRLQRHLPEARVPAVLHCRGRSWAASYCGDLKCKKIDAVWKDFVLDNGLRLGDACVFELLMPTAGTGAATKENKKDRSSSQQRKMIKEVVFRVQVLRGGLPEQITSKGATSDEPLVIRD